MGNRPFFSPREPSAFAFGAERFTLPNAYWLSVLSQNLYAEEKYNIAELTQWGFKESGDDRSHDHLVFLSESRDAQIKIAGIDFGSITYADVQAIWAERKEGVLIAFRGTTPINRADIITNLKLYPLPTRTMGRVDMGFWGALEVVWDDLYRRALKVRRRDFNEKFEILSQIAALPDNEMSGELDNLTAWQIPLPGKLNFMKRWRALAQLPPEKADEALDDLFRFLQPNWPTKLKPIWLTGHSMGGGLAQIATARLLLRGFNVGGLFTYGAPRAGDSTFTNVVEVMAKEAGIREKNVRFVNGLDGVARVPPLWGTLNLENWDHMGRLKYFPELEGNQVELWTSREDTGDLPLYLKDLPRDNLSDWANHHSSLVYIRKLEKLVFDQVANCD